MMARDDEAPRGDQIEALKEILAGCRIWRRSPGGLAFVAVPIAADCVVDWAFGSDILARWVRGKAHNLRLHISDQEIADAIEQLVSDPAREIAPPGSRSQGSAARSESARVAEVSENRSRRKMRRE